MKITVFGAGATGGNFAVRLARAGNEVSVIARGAHLKAIRERGLTLRTGSESVTVRLPASDDAADFGPQDVVIAGVKATGLPQIAAPMRPLVGSDTLVVFPQNGIPWWYPVGLGDRPAPPDLPQFRLAGAFLDHIPTARVIGGSILSGNEVVAPGVVLNTSPDTNRLELGTLAGAEPPALLRLRAACTSAGIVSPDCSDIRRVIWRKLLSNMSGSVLGLITRNKASVFRRDPALAAQFARVVDEGLAIAAAYGYELRDEVDAAQMIARAPDHNSSILQDYLGGRPMEVGEIVLSPQAFARKAGIATPVLDTLAALAQRLAEDAGLFRREGW